MSDEEAEEVEAVAACWGKTGEGGGEELGAGSWDNPVDRSFLSDIGDT